jgi:hypothetical protein
MDSITLKSELGKVVRMYGFNRLNKFMIEWEKTKADEHIWSGSKNPILLKDESFWKELVWSNPMVSDCYKDYQRKYSFCRFAVTSGLSAIESLKENNYILIVETKE